MRWRPAFVLAAVLAFPGAASTQPYAFVSGSAADAIGVVDLGNDTLLGTLALPGTPAGAALTRDGKRLFVARSRLDSVAMIDTATGGVTSIPVGDGPSAVTWAPRAWRAFVANTGDDTVSVVDPVAAAVVATIPVGAAPVDLVPDGARVYVANWNDGTVSVIDWISGTVVGTVSVGAMPAGLALHAPAGRLYVANFFDDTVSVIDATALSVVATVPVVRRPRGLVLDPLTSRLYVAGFEDGRIDVIDTATNTVVLQGASGGENPMDLLLGPGGHRLYVAHLETGSSIRVLDAATLAPLDAIDAPAGPIALAGLGQQAPPTGSAARDISLSLPALPHARRAPLDRQPPVPTDATFSDTEFFNPSWQVVFAVGNHSTNQQIFGGNPGPFRRSIHFAGPSAVETTHVLFAEFYDPGVQGHVTSIDASWDRRILPPSVGQRAPGTAEEGFVVVQGGVAYRTAPEEFSSLLWEGASRVGLTAADFDDGSGGHPNFTATGGLISVGYFRRSPPAMAVEHGIDNFLVTVHSGSGGPAGVFGLSATTGVVVEKETFTANVERVGGNSGTVSVTVLIETPSGLQLSDTFVWLDGDDSPQPLTGSFALPPFTGIRTGRVRLANPTGGATIHPSLDTLLLAVVPADWPPELFPLVGLFQLLLAGFSPLWLLALAAPAGVLAVRRRRARQAASVGVLILSVVSLPGCLASRPWEFHRVLALACTLVDHECPECAPGPYWAGAGLPPVVVDCGSSITSLTRAMKREHGSVTAADAGGGPEPRAKRMERTTVLPGVELEYDVRGTGEPVLLIHNGVGVDWYEPLLAEPALAGRYRLITYHRAGYAGSSPVAGAIDFGQEAAHCRLLLRHMGIPRAHVVGHSSSAMIALRLALDAPEAVRSLALLEPALMAVPSPPEVPRAIELFRTGDKPGAVDTFFRGTCGNDYRAVLDRAVPGSFDRALAGADRFFGQELPALRQWTFGPDEAKRVTQPALAVLGAKTGDQHRQRHALLVQWLPSVEPFLLPDAGHLLHLENPRGMAEGLAAFFARHPIEARNLR